MPSALPGMLSLDYGTMAVADCKPSREGKHCLVLAHRTLRGVVAVIAIPIFIRFVCGCLVYLASHVETLLVPHWMILAFILTINWSYMQGLFLGSLFYSIVLYVCLFMPYHMVLIAIFYVMSLESVKIEYFNFILLFQNCFGHFGGPNKAIQIPYEVFLFLQNWGIL